MGDDTTLSIERIIAASPEVIFGAWTSRDAMQRWYRDRPDDVVDVVELDVRVGGHYRVEFGPRGARPYVEHGTYLEIDAPRRLVMLETLETPTGVAWADTTVTVTLEAELDKTRLILVHERFPSAEQRDNAAGGWPGFIDRIAELVTAGEPGERRG